MTESLRNSEEKRITDAIAKYGSGNPFWFNNFDGNLPGGYRRVALGEDLVFLAKKPREARCSKKKEGTNLWRVL